MIPVDVAACVDDLVTRVISDAAGDYPGVHTREGVIGDRMATAEDIVELQNAELTVAQREAVGAQAAGGVLPPRGGGLAAAGGGRGRHANFSKSFGVESPGNPGIKC